MKRPTFYIYRVMIAILGLWYGWSVERAGLQYPLKNSTLVGRWAGFEDTHYLEDRGMIVTTRIMVWLVGGQIADAVFF